MAIQVIYNQTPGPLPLTASFNCPTDGPATLIISGSVWTAQANTMIGIEVLLDGVVVGMASIYSNLASTHRAVVPTYIPVKLTFGAHKLSLVAAKGGTVSDLNDHFSAVLAY